MMLKRFEITIKGIEGKTKQYKNLVIQSVAFSREAAMKRVKAAKIRRILKVKEIPLGRANLYHEGCLKRIMN